jgi:hypothetical protein
MDAVEPELVDAVETSLRSIPFWTSEACDCAGPDTGVVSNPASWSTPI